MKKYKNLILIVAAIVFVAAAVLTFIIWQSLKLSNDLQNNPDTQTTQQNDKNYNLEDKDTSWDSDNSALSSDGSSSSDEKKDERTTEKKGNGSGNDTTTDKTPGTIAPIDQSNGSFNADSALTCREGPLNTYNAEIAAIENDTKAKLSAVKAEEVRINNILQANPQQYETEIQKFKNAHGGRDFRAEETEINKQKDQKTQAATNRFMAATAGC